MNEEEEEEDDEEEVKLGYHKKMENKKLKKEDLDLDVKEDMDLIMSGEELSEDFKILQQSLKFKKKKLLVKSIERVDPLEEEFKKEIQFRKRRV